MGGQKKGSMIMIIFVDRENKEEVIAYLKSKGLEEKVINEMLKKVK